MTFKVHMNSEDHTTDLFWRAEGGTFGSETQVGLKSLHIYPMRYETANGHDTKLKNLPHESVIVKTNLIESGRFNPCKVIATFPLRPRTTYVSCHFDQPGKSSSFALEINHYDSL